jgi:hypothetical protein
VKRFVVLGGDCGLPAHADKQILAHMQATGEVVDARILGQYIVLKGANGNVDEVFDILKAWHTVRLKAF